jgi:predicted TIM-barrel fold metal-dependent hydrolase
VEAVDVHQHLWSEPLVEALAARADYPRVRRDGRAWRLDLAPGRSEYLPLESPAERAAHVRADGFDRALIALSPELGVERLPGEEAAPLLDAHVALAREPGLGIWASTSLHDLDAAARELPRRLDGAAGLCLPAAALASPRALEALAPLLAALEEAGKPLLVHPGPAAAAVPRVAAPRAAASPAWWPELAGAVAQQQAAWLAFADRGRIAHPRLRVVFAGLAGLAPLQVERAAARGGPSGAVGDPGIFYDTSAYGSFAIDAMARLVGVGQLVHGSDRPAVEPPAGPAAALDAAAWHAMATANVTRLLAGDAAVSAAPAARLVAAA